MADAGFAGTWRASCRGSPGRRFRPRGEHSAARFFRSRATSARGANATACPTDASRRSGRAGQDDRRSARRRWRAPATRRRRSRAKISAGRRSGGCRRTCPTPRRRRDAVRRRSARSGWPGCARAIFGTPDVPDVSSTHSVGTCGSESCSAGTMAGAQTTRTGRSSAGVVQRTRVDHDGVGLGTGDQSAEVIGCGIGRQNRQPARHAVELDQRQRAGELARRRDDDRAAGKLGKPAAKTCSARQMIDAKPRRAIPEESLRRSVGDAASKRRRVAAHFHTLSRSRRASAGTWRPRRP